MATRTFTVFHADHGITDAQMQHVQAQLADTTGFFIRQVSIPAELGSVPCGLYGPSMGDGAVPRDAVKMLKRSDDRPADPILVGFKTRPVDHVQAIGIAEGDEVKLFTVYGGPLAPRNPNDPSIETDEERAEAKAFWDAHALVG